eukprot:gene2023-2153_t
MFPPLLRITPSLLSSKSLRKSLFSSLSRQGHIFPIAIIGSGPSSFYTTKYLLDQNEDIHIDIYEKLPFPYGLVRYGVAPDHPEVKSVTNTFEEIFQSPKNQSRLRYFGNIEIGQDQTKQLSLSSLLSHYSAVILAYGAHSDHDLGLPNEHDISGVLSSREFVNWYNGHPDYQHLHRSKHLVDEEGKLRKIKNVVIIGNGNVAIDCARICMKDLTDLAKTDITKESLEWIEAIQTDLESVSIIGRRGHVQSSFTIKELRELSRLTNEQQPIPTVFHPDELQLGLTEASKKELDNNRPKKRIMELIDNIAKQSPPSESRKKIEMRFLLSPTQLIADPTDQHIQSIRLQRNELTGPPHEQKAKAIADEVQLPCDLLIKSIGYKSISIDPLIPFNKKTNTVSHKDGKALFESNSPYENKLFVTGWLKRGPTGIIGTNITDARETTSTVIETINSPNSASYPQDYDPIEAIQASSEESKNVFSQSIHWHQVQKINQVELERGERQEPKKLREKFTTRREMIQIAKS